MTTFQKVSMFLVRVSLGWLLFYAGITKVLNPAWSAEGYLKSAKTFSWFYNFVASANVLPITNFLNEWGLTLIGISLVLGIFVRLSGVLGAILMLLYYFPVLDFLYPNAHSFIVDEHVVYALALLVLASFKAGRVGGLDKWCSNLPLCSRYPRLRALFG